MNQKKKAIAFTAFNIIIALIILISLFFGILSICPSPLGTYIDVYVRCDETGKGIPGVLVSCDGKTGITNDKGYTCFGSGVPVGTYTVSFVWNGQTVSKNITIDCSKQRWEVTFEVPNPVIIKHFVYESGMAKGEPIANLTVELWEDGVYKTSAVTDATGTVTFGGDVVEVCKAYVLKYKWNSESFEEGPIHFTADDCATSIVWEKTNPLEPKSGGGK